MARVVITVKYEHSNIFWILLFSLHEAKQETEGNVQSKWNPTLLQSVWARNQQGSCQQKENQNNFGTLRQSALWQWYGENDPGLHVSIIWRL